MRDSSLLCLPYISAAREEREEEPRLSGQQQEHLGPGPGAFLFQQVGYCKVSGIQKDQTSIFPEVLF